MKRAQEGCDLTVIKVVIDCDTSGSKRCFGRRRLGSKGGVIILGGC